MIVESVHPPELKGPALCGSAAFMMPALVSIFVAIPYVRFICFCTCRHAIEVHALAIINYMYVHSSLCVYTFRSHKTLQTY